MCAALLRMRGRSSFVPGGDPDPFPRDPPREGGDFLRRGAAKEERQERREVGTRCGPLADEVLDDDFQVPGEGLKDPLQLRELFRRELDLALAETGLHGRFWGLGSGRALRRSGSFLRPPPRSGPWGRLRLFDGRAGHPELLRGCREAELVEVEVAETFLSEGLHARVLGHGCFRGRFRGCCGQLRGELVQGSADSGSLEGFVRRRLLERRGFERRRVECRLLGERRLRRGFVQRWHRFVERGKGSVERRLLRCRSGGFG